MRHSFFWFLGVTQVAYPSNCEFVPFLDSSTFASALQFPKREMHRSKVLNREFSYRFHIALLKFLLIISQDRSTYIFCEFTKSNWKLSLLVAFLRIGILACEWRSCFLRTSFYFSPSFVFYDSFYCSPFAFSRPSPWVFGCGPFYKITRFQNAISFIFSAVIIRIFFGVSFSSFSFILLTKITFYGVSIQKDVFYPP